MTRYTLHISLEYGQARPRHLRLLLNEDFNVEAVMAEVGAAISEARDNIRKENAK